MIETGLISRLNADATVSSLISGRIYPLILPESPTYPAVTYRSISAVHTYDLIGMLVSTTSRIEFTVWSPQYGECKTIQDAIRASLDTFSGSLPDGTHVAFCWRDGAAVDAFDSESRAYSTSVDYRLTH